MRYNIFISASSQDASWRDRLVAHLRGSASPAEFHVWTDSQIPPGSDWRATIVAALSDAHLAIILVSSDFLASRFITEVEIPLILERREAGGMPVLPVLLRPCAWQGVAWLANLQHLPSRHAISEGTEAAIDRDFAVIARQARLLVDSFVPDSPLGTRSSAVRLLAKSGHALVQSDSRHGEDEGRGKTLSSTVLRHRREIDLQIAEARLRRGQAALAGASTDELDLAIRELIRRKRRGPELRCGDRWARGRYELSEELGAGGFGRVWKAYDHAGSQWVAIKFLHPYLASDETNIARFARGARQMQALRHPAIVGVLAPCTEERGWHFFVMEFIDGEDLEKVVVGGKATKEQLMMVVLRIADALEYAHAQGLVHRDVSPSNVLITSGEQPRLTDFDLVWAADTTGGTQGRLLGKLPYVALDPPSSTGAPDARMDVYSLGMVALFAYSGRPLPADVVRRTDAVIEDLEVGPAIKRVLARALATDPSRRYQSMREFSSGLREAAASDTADVTPADPWPQCHMRQYAFDVVTVNLAGETQGVVRTVAHGYVQPLGLEAEIELVELDGGSFLMGASDTPPGRYPNEEPLHTVRIAPLAIARFPVTQRQWRAVRRLPQVRRELRWDIAQADADDAPVERVTWDEAVEFCERLNRATGRTYRLPSEAEWEYAARGGTRGPYHFGAALPLALANFGRTRGGCSTQSTSLAANAYGLFDCHGNVWEWCLDEWHDSYEGAPCDGTAWIHSRPAAERVLRGGSWLTNGEGCRSSYRLGFVPNHRQYGVGFRIVAARRDAGVNRGL